MTITIISKHLPSIFNVSSRKYWDEWLEVCHVVESARYHYDRTCFISENPLQMPKDFVSGLDIKGDECNRYYRFMALWIEIEAFYKSSKQFLDLCWCFLGRKLNNGADKISFLSEAIYDMKRNVKKSEERDKVNNHPFFNLLKTAWNNWGNEVAKCRNFVEHHHPLGGLGQSYAVFLNNGKEIIEICLPDNFPEYADEKSKKKLTYKKQIKAKSQMKDILIRMDNLTTELIELNII